MCVHNVNRMLIVHAYAIGVLLVLQGQQRDVFVSSSSSLLCCLTLCAISYTVNNIECVNNGAQFDRSQAVYVFFLIYPKNNICLRLRHRIPNSP